MHNSELFRPCGSAENSFNKVTLIEAKPVGTPHRDTQPQGENISYEPLFLVPGCFMIVWAILALIVSESSKIAQSKGRVVTANRFKQLPCRNCRFNNNHHLKCAVHPATAMTRQALDCSDCWSQ